MMMMILDLIIKSGIKNEKSFKDALKKLEAELALEKADI